MEYYKREQINELWQIYMAKCVSAGIDKNILPDYTILLKRAKGEPFKQETPEQITARLIDKVNKVNGGQ